MWSSAFLSRRCQSCETAFHPHSRLRPFPKLNLERTSEASGELHAGRQMQGRSSLFLLMRVKRTQHDPREGRFRCAVPLLELDGKVAKSVFVGGPGRRCLRCPTMTETSKGSRPSTSLPLSRLRARIALIMRDRPVSSGRVGSHLGTQPSHCPERGTGKSTVCVLGEDVATHLPALGCAAYDRSDHGSLLSRALAP